MKLCALSISKRFLERSRGDISDDISDTSSFLTVDFRYESHTHLPSKNVYFLKANAHGNVNCRTVSKKALFKL